MKIYTKTGDEGKTSLFGGRRVSKTNHRLEAYGSVDELNSYLGVMIAKMPKEWADEISYFQKVQSRLFNLGSQLACDDPEMAKKLPSIDEQDVLEMEDFIDSHETILEELKNFILPGGTNVSATAHVARTVCRRVERICLGFFEDNSSMDPAFKRVSLSFLNRLSDLLFVTARWCNHKQGVKDIIWKP